ncbi:MAG: hypothetical protein AB1529_05050 [Candidatus Micrarchaeota archaeon]
MRHILILLLICGLSMAFSVRPDYNGVQDTGNKNLGTVEVNITIDCDSKEVTADVFSNESGAPVSGATAYMFYTDYTYQALPNSGKTDSNGRVKMAVPGTIRFLTALFILRVDHYNFQSREIEFTYKKCFEAPPQPPPNGTNQTGPESECAFNEDCADGEYCSVAGECEDVRGSCGYARNHSWVPYECGDFPECPSCPQGFGCVDNVCKEAPSPGNVTPPGSGNASGPGTGSGGPVAAPPSACPLGAVLLALLFLRARA